jgi:hypothetical protein
VAEAAADRVVSLPMSPTLARAEIGPVCSALEVYRPVKPLPQRR